MEQLKDLITANQLSSVTTNICEKTTKNFVTNTTFNKEIKKVAEDVAKEISDINIPSKVSDLENDTGFITTSDIPAIPEKVSDLTNDSEFVTKVVNDLVNYYLKSETYSKTEVDTLVSTVANIKFEIVNTLPTDNIKTNVIYLVPKSNLTVGNVKEEYINLDGTTTGWERIGDTDIDLEGYVTTDSLNTTLADYVTSSNLNTRLNYYAQLSSLSAVAKTGNYTDLYNRPTIPSKISELTNDSGFITTGDIPSKVSDLVNDTGFITTGDIPTKVSDIDNDLGFITASDIPSIPTKVSDLSNDTGFITTGDIPDTTSDLTNDSGFITNVVNDLVNYYLKSETYSKTEVDTLVSAIKSSRFEVVDELPTEDIKTNVIYIVPSSDPNAGNIKNELINLDGTVNGWEIIGSTDINLSGYITTSDLNTALANYTTTSDLNTLLANYVQSSSLASVATSGEYADIKNIPTIPTKISDLTNDSGFITTGDIPSKVSDLDNDLGFITTGDIPSKTSDLTNDSGFITASDIPANVSDLINDSNFITNTVDNLIIYYLKSEAYSKTEVDTIVSAIKNSRFEVVNSLPTEDIKTNVIYLTPSLDPSVGDIKDEYINLDGTTSGWERIASTDIKITNYINRTDLNEALADYTTTVDLTALIDAKQDKVQYETLPTASADYVGKVFQYIGTTNNDFIHGYFYECKEDNETYTWEQTNTQNSYTAGDGGHTIEDSEGTELTQRDILQFGDGFVAEDDDTNEKTVISPNVMQSGDMDDVITPLPSVQTRYHKYSTEEQVVGEWIDGKPVYEIVVPFENMTLNPDGGSRYSKVLVTIANVDTPISYNLYVTGIDDNFGHVLGTAITSSMTIQKSAYAYKSLTSNGLRIMLNNDKQKTVSGIVIARYTKTTT